MARGRVVPRGDPGLELEHLELVPVGVCEPEDRPPVFLLDRVRDLDAFLAESRFLLHGVLRGEHESGVPLLRTGIGAEMQVDIRTSRRDRDPVGERGHDPETEFLCPPFQRALLIPNDDRDRRKLEHEWGIERRMIRPRSLPAYASSGSYFFGSLPSMTFTSPISRRRTDSPICSFRNPSNSSAIRFHAGSLCSRHASKSPYLLQSHSCAPANRPNPRT